MIVSPSKAINAANLHQLTEQYGYEPKWLETQSGEKIYALHRELKEQKTTIVVLHGNALNLNLQPWFGVLQSLAATGFNILALDYQGYGLSEGKAGFSAMLSDAALVKSLVDDGATLYVYGLSLGSVMAVSLAKDSQGQGLIHEGGMTDVTQMVPLYKSRKLFGNVMEIELEPGLEFDNVAELKQIQKPLLVIHGEKDKNIPPQMGKALYQTSSHPLSAFYTVANGGHCDSFLKDEKNYMAQIDKFIHQVSTTKQLVHKHDQ